MAAPSPVVLFDLDGTLIDSAPDLAGAANRVRESRNLPPLPLSIFRPMTSAGARGMLRVALGLQPGDAGYEAARIEFLAQYESGLTQLTHVFPAMVGVLDALDRARVPWGIVTNKMGRYTDPIVAALGLAVRAATVISGDTTAHAKPHPAPLLEAAQRMGVAPAACFYVGDDLRDVQAGHAAGMCTVAAGWGYLGDGEPMDRWGAHHCIEEPAQLLALLKLDGLP